ncbi:hypothetical protein KZY59_10425 [Prevotella buccae]|nr:hypothetical protein [Segatella buccae]MBW4871947.1 hypothetical protein [Segatella buccae]
MNFGQQHDEGRREELIRQIEHSVAHLSLPELEALYYDMLTKDYIQK